MSNKKEIKRINYLMHRLNNTDKELIEIWGENRMRKGLYKLYSELYSLLEKHEIKKEDYERKWIDINIERWKTREEYRKNPIKVRQDNKDVQVGSGGSNCNKIRYPKKCRKTAWKRFYKLFPHLKNEKH